MGNSTAMQHVMEEVARAAAASAHVVVSGEPGTGREMIARAIHAQAGAPAARSSRSTAEKYRRTILEAMLFATAASRTRASNDAPWNACGARRTCINRRAARCIWKMSLISRQEFSSGSVACFATAKS
jgi:hypothetical protein